jgi:hypothetical protein
MYINSMLMYMLGTLEAGHWRLGTGTPNCYIRRCEDTWTIGGFRLFSVNPPVVCAIMRKNSGLRRTEGLQMPCGSSFRVRELFSQWSRGSPAWQFASLCTKPALPAV